MPCICRINFDTGVDSRSSPRIRLYQCKFVCRNKVENRHGSRIHSHRSCFYNCDDMFENLLYTRRCHRNSPFVDCISFPACRSNKMIRLYSHKKQYLGRHLLMPNTHLNPDRFQHYLLNILPRIEYSIQVVQSGLFLVRLHLQTECQIQSHRLNVIFVVFLCQIRLNPI